MYAFFLRWMPVWLANAAITCWYGGLLFLLWLKWGGEVSLFRYGQL
ncbi:MAG: hypothetical protein JWQ01_4423 [Massilia sp.]|nr:hypothetical protein [Massilia sp.]